MLVNLCKHIFQNQEDVVDKYDCINNWQKAKKTNTANMTNIELFKDAIYPLFWDNGSYSFLHLEIQLKDAASKQSLIDEKEKASCFVTLIHEYIHYIQNFTTTWGFTNFITYIDLLVAFFSKNSSLDKNPDLPLSSGSVNNSFGNKNYSNYLESAFLGVSKGKDESFLFEDTDQANFTIIESKLIDPYWIKEVNISYLAYNGKQIPINKIVLSENMAIVGSYLSSGMSIEESKQSIDKLFGPKYHIIYSFLNNLFPEKNCLKLTYVICESSLLILPYNRTISKILQFLQVNASVLQIKAEDEILSKALEHINFEKSLTKLIPKILEQIETRVQIFNKHKQEYEFYKYVLDVLSIFKNGLSERLINMHTYRNKFDSDFLNFFSKKIYSPIIVFSDKQKTMLGEPTENFVNSIASLSGVLKIFHLAYFNEIKRCPLNEDFSICTVAKGMECDLAALDVHGKHRYKGCLMNNALNIIGIRKEGRK